MWYNLHYPPHPQAPWSHQHLLVVGLLSPHHWICNWNHLPDYPDSYLKKVMRKYLVTRTVTVTVSETVEAEMDPQDVKDFVGTKTKSLAGVLSDLGLAEKYNDVHYTFGETTVTEIK